MYNLIITIVAIALTVAATAAAMFYGGDTLTQGRDRADAAAFVTGGQQIIGAIQMYAATDGGVLDEDTGLTPLMTDNYLNGLPVVKGEAWQLDDVNKLVISAVESESVCIAINRQASLDDAITELESLENSLFGCVTDNGDHLFVIKY